MKKYLLLIVVLLILLGGCKQDMQQLQVGNAASPKKILIAGDTSEFKQKVLDKVLEKIGKDNYSIRIIGLDYLKKEKTADYGAIVLVNTLWATKLDGRVDEFLKADPTNKKVIIFTSVGSENWKPDVRVDAVTSASRLDRVEQKAAELAGLIQKRF